MMVETGEVRSSLRADEAAQPMAGNKLPWHTFFRSLQKSEEGTSILELAIAAPVLIILLLGITELGDGLTKRVALQQAVSRAIEDAQAGAVGGTYDHIKPGAAAAADVPESNVILEQWLECDGAKKKFDEICSTGQMAVKYIRLEISKTYTPMFGRSGYTTVDKDGLATIRSSFHLRVPN